MLSRFFRREKPDPAAREKLEQGVEKTRAGFFGRIKTLLTAERPIDDDLWDELEELLIQADVGVALTDRLMERMREEHRKGEIQSSRDLFDALKDALATSLEDVAEHRDLIRRGELSVVLVVGVNGVGKTTSIAKLGNLLQQQGYKVVLAAGDTFRAAAVEQLAAWGERAGCEVIRAAPGSDPGAVAFDAVEAARARGHDVVICDTAGRLHTQQPLMEELRKVRRVIAKQMPDAPHETLLTIDATTGQNGLRQAMLFREAVDVTGIVLTKLDGTAKGGIALAIAQELGVPVKLIGVGEGLEDLRPFDPDDFARAILEV